MAATTAVANNASGGLVLQHLMLKNVQAPTTHKTAALATAGSVATGPPVTPESSAVMSILLQTYNNSIQRTKPMHARVNTTVTVSPAQRSQ